VVAMMVDGVLSGKDSSVVVALGIDIDCHKHLMDF
jgi:hypothetical protein